MSYEINLCHPGWMHNRNNQHKKKSSEWEISHKMRQFKHYQTFNHSQCFLSSIANLKKLRKIVCIFFPYIAHVSPTSPCVLESLFEKWCCCLLCPHFFSTSYRFHLAERWMRHTYSHLLPFFRHHVATIVT